MKITRATIADLNVLTPLFDAYRIFYGQASDHDAARAFVQERLEKEESVIFLARDERSGDGLGFTQLYPSFTSVRMKRLWILNDLYVCPSARRRGVARALMDAAHEMARLTGAAGVELATATNNAAAKPLYEDMGYRQDDAFHHYSWDT